MDEAACQVFHECRVLACIVNILRDIEGASDHEVGERTLSDENRKSVIDKVYYQLSKNGRDPVYGQLLGHADNSVSKEAWIRSRRAKPIRWLKHLDTTKNSRQSLPTGAVDYFAVDCFPSCPSPSAASLQTQRLSCQRHSMSWSRRFIFPNSASLTTRSASGSVATRSGAAIAFRVVQLLPKQTMTMVIQNQG